MLQVLIFTELTWSLVVIDCYYILTCVLMFSECKGTKKVRIGLKSYTYKLEIPSNRQGFEGEIYSSY